MTKSNVIEFTVWEKDDTLEIQLEPECYLFRIEPGNSLKFVVTDAAPDFEWAIRVDNGSKGLQLFPGYPGDIEIYENNVLLENWFKYM